MKPAILLGLMLLAGSARAMTGHAPGVGGMVMNDNPTLSLVRIDQLEAVTAGGQRWEAQAWHGNDSHKLWLRSEGERQDGRLRDGDVEVLWYRPLSAFWGTQLGLRHDLGDGPRRDWAAFGVQGLAPYWFEVEATAYVGPAGRSSARLRTHYDLLLTQRLILQPELEANAYGQADLEHGTGSGLSDARVGVRLRYELRREFAPYVGLVRARRVGDTATLARLAGTPAGDTELVLGLRLWF